MKKIPDLRRVPLRHTLFADGEYGMAEQHLRNDEYDITVIRKRPDDKSPFTMAISIGGISGSFSCVEDANKAIADAGRLTIEA